MTKQIIWHTEKRRVNDLLPYEKNPRTMSDKQLSDLKTSIKKFNLAEIPAITIDHKILAGHQRIRVLQLLGRGEEEIDVRVPNRQLDEKEFKEYLLRSNSNHGSWDYSLLKEIDLDILLESGLNGDDLLQAFDNDIEIENDDWDEEKEIQKINKTDIKLGDIFQLGRHFLICGDSHKKETLDKLMGNIKAGFICNDPIYNTHVNYDKGIGNKSHYGGDIIDCKNDEEYKEFLKLGLENSLRHADKNCHVFTWSDERYIWLIQTLFKEHGIKNERVCFWVKNGFCVTPNVAFNKIVEICTYGSIGRPFLSPLSTKTSEILNKEIGTGNRTIDDITDAINIWLAKRDAGILYNHSTQKPLDLYEKPLRRCTKPGDVVLDIYGGSGSLLLAADQLKRICYMSEINPIFCQLIINRYEKYANTKAKKLN
jgi:DNA modification methylase